MKVEINTGKETKEINLLPLTGRHLQKATDLLIKADSGDVRVLKEYNDYLDDLGCKLSGLSMDELLDLPLDEKDKITGFLARKLFEHLDFTRRLAK